jgi:hypothetical protein
MKGNFAAKLGTKDSRVVVDARGWIRWNEIPATITRVTVEATVTQSELQPTERHAFNVSGELRRDDAHPEMEWRCDAREQNDKEFFRATARGGGLIRDAGGSSWSWPWVDSPFVD